MNKLKRRLLSALVIAILALPTLVVLAKEIGSLTITGPGIKGELTVDDPRRMMNLEQAGFFDQSILTKPPTGLNTEGGYSIVVSLNLDGRIVPFVEMVYYPTTEGQPGYVHYTSRLQGDILEPVDEWGLMNRSADTAFREIMTASNVTLQSALMAASVKSEGPSASAAEPVTVPVTPTTTIQPAYIAGTVLVMALLFIGAGVIVRRRNTHTAS